MNRGRSRAPNETRIFSIIIVLVCLLKNQTLWISEKSGNNNNNTKFHSNARRTINDYIQAKPITQVNGVS